MGEGFHKMVDRAEEAALPARFAPERAACSTWHPWIINRSARAEIDLSLRNAFRKYAQGRAITDRNGQGLRFNSGWDHRTARGLVQAHIFAR